MKKKIKINGPFIKKNQKIADEKEPNIDRDYIQSLTRLKNSQDKLAMAIKSQIGKLSPIPISFENIPDPKTFEDMVSLLTSK